MKFLIGKSSSAASSSGERVFSLVPNSWDDFGFKTSFDLVYFDDRGGKTPIGGVRIASRGLKFGHVVLPEETTGLEQEYFSLGSSSEYYRRIAQLSEDVRRTLLIGLRDIVFNPDIYRMHESEPAMKASLLRFSSFEDLRWKYPAALRNEPDPTSFNFTYKTTTDQLAQNVEMSFGVNPNSEIPTNIHVLIGKNGVGKTRFLAGMCDALAGNTKVEIGIDGHFTFFEGWFESSNRPQFLNVLAVSFSVFDRFTPAIETHRDTDKFIPYSYIGIKQHEESGKEGAPIRTKSTEEIVDEFRSCLRNISSVDDTRRLWRRCIKCLLSDPYLADLNILRIAAQQDSSLNSDGNTFIDELTAEFDRMSSGHKIVLLTVSRLVELVRERSLVIFDEPETHLHPPLVGSLVRALSVLLVSRNAVAIISTHSPVVLQEVPSSCVQIISRSGNLVQIDRPDVETFAESVGPLTRKIFKVELEKSGFYSLLSDLAQDTSAAEVYDKLNGQIGGEGRALLRSMGLTEEKA